MTVAVAQGPARRRLVLGGVGLVCAGVALLALWLLAGYAGAKGTTGGGRPVTATVRATGSCVGGGGDQDTVSFTVDGQPHQAKLDGCGHQPGETLTVLVPAAFDGNTVLEPTDATQGNSAGMSRRVAFILLVVAAGVGGGCAYLIFRRRPKTKAKAGQRSTRMAESTRYAEPAEPRQSEPVVARVGGGEPAEITGVNWFEDSSTGLSLAPDDHDSAVGEHPDRSRSQR